MLEIKNFLARALIAKSTPDATNKEQLSIYLKTLLLMEVL